ncbi:hypothetical protein HYDPIDRAFT_116834 [Hydnomerulius pinastri MD-312]|uniref:CHAT domain-containing protein n=1 Tax=Hydnomerulius pinastri MD-312 TaxID=994086 RepID=A0A0C9VSC9_9AGAM|nr:hypothetical protein HYDPIDRAFT_116834 [Hydnomerulius pinastri MD-312]
MEQANTHESPPMNDSGAEARVFPGAFELYEAEYLSATEKKYSRYAQGVLLCVFAWVCIRIGAVSMSWLWYRWNKNYVWVVDRIVILGLLISPARILSALANVYGAENGIYSETSKPIIIVTLVVSLICAVLFIVYHGILLLRGLKKKDYQAVGEQLSGQHRAEQASTYESPTTEDSSARAGVPGQPVVITNLKATNVATGLRRIPAGFYVSVSIGNDDRRTKNNSVCPISGVTEWNDLIDLPSELSTEVEMWIYASFELGYMLGQGELLGKFSVTVGELLERSRSSRPIPFSIREGEIASSCASLEVTVEVLSPSDEVLICRPAAACVEPRLHDELFLAQATDAGHNHMHHYYKDCQESRLDQAIGEFKRVVGHCHSQHPGRGAALVNLAMAKFIKCQTREAYLDLDEPISLYQEALDLRPPGHPDRSCTLINLSVALLTRFRGRGYITLADADEAEELLWEALDVCPPESHEHREALVVVAFNLHSGGDHIPISCVLPQASSRSSRLPLSLNELTRLRGECEMQDNPRLLDDIIARHVDAESHIDMEGEEWVLLQSSLIAALAMRFGRQGRIQDLDESIQRGRAISLRCPNDCAILNNLASALWARFEQRGDEKDLDEAIPQYQIALQLMADDHPARSVSLNDLGNALLTRFQQRGDRKDLDDAIQHHRVALQLRPDGHPLRAASLVNLANVLSTRFRQQGDSNDLDGAIQLHRVALQLMGEGHPDRLVLLNNLANALSTRFRLRGDGKDLDEAIEYHRVAVQLMPEGHPLHPPSLSNLASALLIQFEQRGDGKALDEAIKLHRVALQLMPEGHPLRLFSLTNLASALSTQFEQGGDGKDLDEAIQNHHLALQLMSEGDPRRSAPLNNLANALSTRFEQRGDGKDLDEAIQHHRVAVQLMPEGHPGRPASLSNLAGALRKRFGQRGDGKDLDEAIQHDQVALQLRPEGHPDRSRSLGNLANALLARFGQRGDRKDLDEAIMLHRVALQLMPEGHPLRSSSLSDLGNALFTRFEQQGEGKNLDEAIQHHRVALQLRSEGHPGRSRSLSSLANALLAQFEQRGDEKDLDEAIQNHQLALQLMSDGRPLRSASLANLASALRGRFEQRGDMKDLDESIKLHRVALQLMPEGYSQRSASLTNLASALLTRFEQQGDRMDLDGAIQHHRVALELMPEGHSLRSCSFDNLATALFRQFEQRGDGKDLDEAIQYHRVALQLRSEGHPDRSASLNNLAVALLVRSEQRGDRKDLDEAIQHHRVALQLRPEGHPLHPCSLAGLASALLRRFEQRDDGKDLDEAIQHDQTALHLVREGHPDRSALLGNLASALHTRFERRGDGRDLDGAIQHHRLALRLMPDSYPQRSTLLNNLANALLTRFEQCGDPDATQEALRLSYAVVEQALALPSHLRAQVNLARIHLALWRTRHIRQALQDAMDHYNVATQFTPAGLLQRLTASLQWVNEAEEHQHASAMDAYAQSLQLLDSHISATTSVSSRHEARKHFTPDLSVDAASCALRQGNICRAVELLEQGRALYWTQIARFRTSLDDLRSRDPRAEVLVKRFRDLSAMLNRPAQTSFDESRSIAAVEAEARRYRDIAEEWHKVIEEIRTFEGFSRFLLPPLFADLQQAALEGPVVVLVASKFSCDAIIVLHTRSPIHVRLQITLKEIRDLVLKHLLNIHHSDGPDYGTFVEVMGKLWKKVISPVVRELKRLVGKGTRIWWCPTSLFTALPLHSAGEYERGGQVLSRLFISSYTPSLLALIKARTYPKTTSDINFAAIGQAKPSFASWKPLHYVDPEVDEIERLLPTPPVLFTKLTSSESTKQQALRTLHDHQWFHLSCHGKQVHEEPFNSHFAMRDGPLSLLDIIDADISGHEFAFLSACETAMGDLTAPDEVIHLAAGLQFMGVKSVIGTLWSVGDKVAYDLVLAFYKEFCKDGTMDCTMAAGALHKAVASLANEVPLQARAMFVHIGI